MDSGCSCASWWQRPRREVTSFKSHIPLSGLSLPWTLPDTQLPEDLSGRWAGAGGALTGLWFVVVLRRNAQPWRRRRVGVKV